VFDDAADEMRLYADGVRVATAVEGRSPVGNQADMVLGKSPLVPGTQFNRALSDAEIQAIFAAGGAGKCVGP
jgi:hypothetical protein